MGLCNREGYTHSGTLQVQIRLCNREGYTHADTLQVHMGLCNRWGILMQGLYR
ncbi:hypothetical protein DPMN_163603 [Dreissena polymorpha]|uniref:Uncharacterized protein n=1 Tax=Dreissena polymorpha TaxID=45954 RepID=A0A9D4IUR1_DREPO|nr:hypothetical protein DPMN_163603 [Dreissena polymorpha]